MNVRNIIEAQILFMVAVISIAFAQSMALLQIYLATWGIGRLRGLSVASAESLLASTVPRRMAALRVLTGMMAAGVLLVAERLREMPQEATRAMGLVMGVYMVVVITILASVVIPEFMNGIERWAQALAPGRTGLQRPARRGAA